MYAQRASRLAGAVVWTNTPTGDGPVRVLPDGCMDLLWYDGRLLVAGPDTRAHVTDGAPGTWAGVRFHPGTAPALLGVPAEALRDRRVDLTDLWPATRARRLAARVNAAPDPATGLEEAALSRAAETGPPDPLPGRIVAALDAGRPVAATADALGITARTLHRHCLAAFGYGPKTLARVLRLQRALALAREGTPLAETAARTGFADQAHLTRDVRELAGLPPAELLGGRRAPSGSGRSQADGANRATPWPSGSPTTA
ncbi:helix-turn-helix transcriptional regulator [Streptomyces violaceorubidus]|uniref:helix-turn-helix transcriptional regulator n=1 Tax=Streptomyces violaceorubidus TaxID=284042 RepID=UPI000998AC16|nr:helix-turn-helix transcriptional regulator [Streptomyces violaceorubidus]